MAMSLCFDVDDFYMAIEIAISAWLMYMKFILKDFSSLPKWFLDEFATFEYINGESCSYQF